MALLVISTSVFAQKKTVVTVEQDENGWRLIDRGEPVEVKGVVWSFTPIGQTHTYDLFAQDEDFIRKMIDTDMPLLKKMGVNTIRCFTMIPPKWVDYIYTKYGIYSIINDTLGRYGVTVKGTWNANTDYSDLYTREVLIEQARQTAEKYKDSKGVLMYLFGNESNYGLVWSSNEIEDLPTGEKDIVKAGYLYDLMEKAMAACKEVDPNRPVGIVNGDTQYLDLIAKLCPSLDILGVNAYRGYKFYDSFYQNVQEVLNKPIVFTEAGADAFNDILMQEDQAAQMNYLKSQWEEIYRQAYGKGNCQNVLGGVVFEWMDEWWKRYQNKNLDEHDDASWSNAGYDVDYVSDRFLMQDSVTRRYATIIVPDVRFMPLATLQRLVQIAEQGGQVMFVKSFPQSVPGYGKPKEQKAFIALLKQLQKKVSFHPDQAMYTRWGQGGIVTSPTYSDGLQFSKARMEPMRVQQGLSCIRRSNPNGYHYFVSNLQGKDINTFVELGVKARAVIFYNPMTGAIDQAQLDNQGRVKMQLKSGESIILRTFTQPLAEQVSPHKYYNALEYRATSLKGWTLSFKESAPVRIEKIYTFEGSPQSWTSLGDTLLNATMATGVYQTSFMMPKMPSNAAYILDLGDVRESAHVLVNGKDAGILFAVPFRVDITPYLHEGTNTLTIEVTNLPANRIAEMDRQGIEWRKFKEINVVDLNYKTNRYGAWVPVPSGLNSDVKLIPCTVE